MGLAITPANGDGDAGLLIERSAQVQAVDLSDGAGAAEGRRNLAVTGLDLMAEDVSIAINQAIGTGFEIEHHAIGVDFLLEFDLVCLDA